ncbi:CMRF35-like molecule 7 isoform X2 [Heterodontus francisci]|uniref:CMRF35-like molecule 7 isoform X2 n=1 Tax=Heterodontus francisci TaxID=7792 RepID=UPI00355B0BE2
MMELIALLILMSASSSFQLTGPEKVHGELGGSVTVDCQYDRNYKDHVKQWCKGYYYLSCEVVVSTDKPKKGRFSLTDNKTQRIFSVTMDNLMKNDEGYYWCVIEMPTLVQNIKMSVKLEVSEGPVLRTTMGPTTKVTETTEASVTTALTTAFHRTGTTRKGSAFPWQVILSVVVVIILLLLIVAVILYLKVKQQKKSGTNEQSITAVENPAATCKFSKEDEGVTYATVKKVPRVDLESTYINVQDLKAQKTANSQGASETVEYSTVLFRSE